MKIGHLSAKIIAKHVPKHFFLPKNVFCHVILAQVSNIFFIFALEIVQFIKPW